MALLTFTLTRNILCCNFLTCRTIECGTSQHIPFVIWGIIMLVLFCIGLPLVALIMLAKYRQLPPANN